MEYEQEYLDDSDADDDYDRVAHPSAAPDYESSPTDSISPSNEATPTTYHHSGHNHSSPKGRITQWTADQCADYVASLGMEFEQYADAIVEEEIDGEALVAIQHEELKEIGVTSIGHRLTILKGIYDVKVKQQISIEEEHYVPLSADANAPESHATQHDIARIIYQIKLRDEKLHAAEAELRSMKEDLNRVLEESRRLREDVLPVIRMAKEITQPLPTPEGLSDPLPSPHGAVHSLQVSEAKMNEGLSRSLSRKMSNKKFFLGGKQIPSPTIHEGSSLDPSPVALASSHLNASLGPGTAQAVSHANSSQPSPTSPPYNITSHLLPRPLPRTDTYPPLRNAHPADNNANRPFSTTSTLVPSDGGVRGSGDRNNPVLGGQAPPPRRAVPAPLSTTTLPSLNPSISTATLTSNSNNSGGGGSSTPLDPDAPTPFSKPEATSSAAPDILKSFRVSMEEPCHKVLPVALKKYHINDDWRQYSLFIVHGDQERCLGLEEKPLILFKQLQSEGKKPMFMLRKQAAPKEGFAQRREGGGGGGGGGGGQGVLGGQGEGKPSMAGGLL